MRSVDAAMHDVGDMGCMGPRCPGIPEHLWSTVLSGGAMPELFRAIAVDRTGAVVVFGKNAGTMRVGDTSLTTVGLGDFVLSKFTAAGVVQWAHGFGSEGEDSPRSVAVDMNNNIYVTGHYRGPMSFGGDPLPYNTGDEKNLFVASFTPAGVHRWSVGYVGGRIQAGNSIRITGDHVYVSGIFDGSLVTSAGTLSTRGGRDVFVMHFDRNGNLGWQRRYGGPGEEFTQIGAPIAASGGIFLPITFQNTAAFGGLGSRTALGTQDLAILELSPLGSEIRLAVLGDVGTTMMCHGVAVGPEGGPILGAGFSGSFHIGGMNENSIDEDAVLIALRPDLSYRWHRVVSSAGSDRARGVAVAGDGQVFFVGHVTGSLTTEGVTMPGRVGVRNAFVSAFDAGDGSLGWARLWSSDIHGEAWGVATSADRVYVSGLVEGATDFGGGARAATAGGDPAIVAYRTR